MVNIEWVFVVVVVVYIITHRHQSAALITASPLVPGGVTVEAPTNGPPWSLACCVLIEAAVDVQIKWGKRLLHPNG
jgi:hypothetical protein